MDTLPISMQIYASIESERHVDPNISSGASFKQ
jgi:hypothetical protein